MSANTYEYDVIIIGAGGAGMMCAIHAGQRGHKVVLLDHAHKIGRKILISGGGRCNFTNIHATAANFLSQNPHFCKSALSRFTPDDFLSMVRAHRIRFHEKKLGQLFCDQSAQAIVDMLVTECHDAQAEFKMNCNIKSVSKNADRFIVESNLGTFHGSSLVIATGGLSIPTIGASGFGYDLAKQFGLKIINTAPALVGFDLSDEDMKSLFDLSGVSFDSLVTCNESQFQENTLFTHTGISGPAILQSSLYWNCGDTISINTQPSKDLYQELLQKKKQGLTKELKNILADYLPKRLAEKLCDLYLPSRPIQFIADKDLQKLSEQLHAWQFIPKRNFGYWKAEVTKGGVDTDELSAKTMESKKVPGLYFIGEVVDVTGQLGGYNFQWAWASAYAAAQAV